MTANAALSGRPLSGASLWAGLRWGKQILNGLAAPALAAAERSRFAILPARYLEDVGMTEGDRNVALGAAETPVEGWRVVASHL